MYYWCHWLVPWHIYPQHQRLHVDDPPTRWFSASSGSLCRRLQLYWRLQSHSRTVPAVADFWWSTTRTQAAYVPVWRITSGSHVQSVRSAYYVADATITKRVECQCKFRFGSRSATEVWIGGSWTKIACHGGNDSGVGHCRYRFAIVVEMERTSC